MARVRIALLEGGFGFGWLSPDKTRWVVYTSCGTVPHVEPVFKDYFLAVEAPASGLGPFVVFNSHPVSETPSHFRISEIALSDSPLRRGPDPVPPDVFAHLRENLRFAVRIARARSVPAALCTIPTLARRGTSEAARQRVALPGYVYGDFGYFCEIVEACNSAIRSVAADERVPLIETADFVARLPDGESLFAAADIPTPEGARRIAECIAGELSRHKLVPSGR